MKHLYIFVFILSVFLSYGQTRNSIEKPSPEEILITNQIVNDTLWVWDSIEHFQIDYNNEVDLQYTYKILTKNNFGNRLVSKYITNKSFNGNNRTESIDSIVYYDDGGTINKRFNKLWYIPHHEWSTYSYTESTRSGNYIEYFLKHYSSTTNQYTGGLKRYYAYDSEKTIYDLIQDYDEINDEWVNQRKTDYFYDEINNDTLSIQYLWKNNSWYDSIHNINSFEGSNKTRSLSIIYNSNSQTWENSGLTTQSFTIDNLVDTLYNYSWDKETETWQETYFEESYYDDEGNDTLSIIRMADYFTGQMDYFMKVRVIYTDTSLTREYISWDTETQTWYGAEVYYTSYIADDKADTSLNYILYIDSNEKSFYYRYITRYDDKMLEIDKTRYHYDDSEWFIYSQDKYYWSQFITNSIDDNKKELFTVFPIPASNHITFSAEQTGQKCLTIFSISGKVLSEIIFDSKSMDLNCETYLPGMYIYSIESNGLIQTGKLIVQ